MRRFSPLNLRLIYMCFLFFLFLSLNTSTAFSKKNNVRVNSGIKTLSVLKRLLNKSIKRNCKRTKKLGFIVQSLTVGDTLYSYLAHRKRIPASNIKLITSLTGLYYLRPEYIFVTDIYSLSPLVSGVVKGNIFLKGYGDPIFLQENIKELVNKFKLLGVRKIIGNLVVDESFFDKKRFGIGWKKNKNLRTYKVPSSALSLNFNSVLISVDPGKGRTIGALRVRMDPVSDMLRIKSRIEKDNSILRSKLTFQRIFAKKRKDVFLIQGKVPYKGKIVYKRLPVKNPSFYTAGVFSSLLRENSISLTGGIKVGLTPKRANLIVRHSSKNLSSVIRLMNKWSNNFISEQILKTLGAELFGMPGTSKKGLRAITKYLLSIGIPRKSFEIYDGSGLSRMNRITPYAMVKLLANGYHDHRFSSDFLSSLPIYGIDGTLRKRRRLMKDEYRVRAKTGYLNGVSSLSGYVFSKNGEVLAFSLLINSNSCSSKRLVRKITKYLQLFDRSLHKKTRSIVLNMKNRGKFSQAIIKNNFNAWHRTNKPRL
ncbi:MAG: D-alanyl-D-alanine carboxypeptidase/D-alanyl-D-alanine-endopeptidase [Nitrospinota bacterium]|nr:D-alanyl-D-alanine carboxypeptidase/D-alanyl-D-alanine-endopeptidase [Nitrospinota bacterium]